MPSGLKYMDEDKLKKEFLRATEYRKKELTDLRKSRADEVGKQIDTYVKKDGRLEREVTNTVEEGDIIARNPIPIGKNKNNESIYNEWIMKRNVVAENYNINIETTLTIKFTPHQKQAIIKAIEITSDIVECFEKKRATKKGKGEKVLLISVEWADKPMEARIGDYLTDKGYAISKDDMSRGYEAMQSFEEPEQRMRMS